MDGFTDSAPPAVEAIFRRQHALARGAPHPSLAERLARLQRLRQLIRDNEQAFAAAISADFGNRSRVETLMAETLFVQGEIRHAVTHLKRWMAPRHVATQFRFKPGKNRLLPQPLGVVGIIAPWNYPLQLTLAPAVAAVAAGNRVMIKPSELVPRFSRLLRELVAAKFDVAEFAVSGVEEGVARAFADLPFDHLVFTGSTRVGRLVAAAAGRNLTPVTMELGGKSPVVIDPSADLDVAATRIAHGKLLNAGQTCIAPDYAYVPQANVEDFAAKLDAAMRKLYGTEPANEDYTSIVSDQHYIRLEALVADAVAKGARVLQTAPSHAPEWKSRRKFPPTVIIGATPEMTVMQEEIFGPLLPVLGYGEAVEPIAHINAHDRPLALYWFGNNAAARDEMLARTVSGGVTVNDCLLHFTQVNQPMGGVGASGSGAYHGQWGFDALSKLKPIFYRSSLNRFAGLYPPYGARTARAAKLMRWLSGG
jgi:coniferyl-aldehyde dehydrogenase